MSVYIGKHPAKLLVFEKTVNRQKVKGHLIITFDELSLYVLHSWCPAADYDRVQNDFNFFEKSFFVPDQINSPFSQSAEIEKKAPLRRRIFDVVIFSLRETSEKILKNIKSADFLIAALLDLSEREKICLLDSCGVGHSGSRFLIAGLQPLETFEISNEKPFETLRFLDEKLSNCNSFCIFTISYEFGLKLENIKPREKTDQKFNEPDVFLAIFDCLVVHDYEQRETFLVGDEKRFAEIESKLVSSQNNEQFDEISSSVESVPVASNFSKPEYLAAVEKIKERIRRGDTYQTNLTQQLRARLPENTTAQKIFQRLRKNNPAPFAAFLQRNDSTVISASPESFLRFKVQNLKAKSQKPKAEIEVFFASPIKGTRPRGRSGEEDLRLRDELLNSAKDRAENVMIVDLLRNDLGRICEYGSVTVEKLCDLETHPTVFHLVSTIKGELRANVKFSDIIRAAFPCGSITGAPKIRTMQIIDELESAPRGLSMGAIGCSIQNLKIETNHSPLTTHHYFDLSVAIRTMVVHKNEIVFNVGGGVTIDSDAETEYEETLVKARALLDSFNGKF